jgi:hypothetical protein
MPHIKVPFEDYNRCLDNLTDGSNLAMFSDAYAASKIAKEKLRNVVVVEEKIISDYLGFKLPPNFFMFKSLNDKIVQLQESGIMGKFLNFEVKKAAKEEIDPVPLSIDHLSVWFKLWIGLLMVTCLTFIVEILVVKFQGIIMNNTATNSSSQ